MLPPLLSHNLGDLPLDGGGVLPGARLTYRTWGRLAPAGDNAVLLPSHYTGTSASSASLIGPGRALDPEHLFIVATDLFGNGHASSPSHLAADARLTFPRVSVADNVRAQHRLLADLGATRLRLVQGWSLAAVQAWHWAVMYPGMVAAILPVCGASGCWPLNRVFLSGLRQVLEADPAFATPAPPVAGLRAFGCVYAGWAYSPAFYRDELWRGLGYHDLESFLIWWEEDHLTWDAQDLAAALATWRDADICRPFADATLDDALTRVTAHVIAMPCDSDRYFTLEENALEVAATRGAELRPIRSPYGHCAGAPGRFAAETALIEAATRELLARA